HPDVGRRLLPAQPWLRGADHAHVGAHRRGGPGGRGAVGEGRRGAAGARRPAPGEHGVLHPVPPPARSARAGCRARPRGPTLTCMAEAALTPRAEQTRAAIIEAALRLFREAGYEATTMRAIAR